MSDAHAADIAVTLHGVIAKHAPHGFAGFMRGRQDGCPVYVAAVALQDALAECRIPPEGDR